MAQALLQAEKTKPDLIIFGGDNVSSVDMERDPAKVDAQYKNFSSMRDAALRLPSIAALGRRDIWGHGDSAEGASVRGKVAAVSAFKMPSRYYSQAIRGWKLVVLDAWQADGCYIDREQLGWLSSELADAKNPIAIISHAPLLTISGLVESTSLRSRGWVTGSSMAIANSSAVCAMLAAQTMVKLVLAGCSHMVERVDFRGISHCADGAVSGGWWTGSHEGFPPSFAVVDLFSDGSFDRKVVEWESPKRLEHEE